MTRTTCPNGAPGGGGGGGGGGAVTVMAALSLFVWLVALIRAEPAATALTRPVFVTVAAVGLLLVHATAGPVITCPPASLSVAVSRAVSPVCSDTADGATTTVATCGGGG